MTQLHDVLLVTRVSLPKLIGCRAAVRALQFANPKKADAIGATTAEKLEGPHVGWMPIPFLFSLHPSPGFRYCSTPSRTYASFLLSFKSSRRVLEAL